MSTQANILMSPPREAVSVSAHKLRLVVGYIMVGGLLLGLAIYGYDYYTLDVLQRPFSAKHHLLRPSGAVGLKLGMLGLACFVGIFLYALRKRWPWLQRLGATPRWLDNHILLGVSAPLIIAFHAAFKFRGFAGIAFWIMLAVSLSGIVGRYLYAQIPRSLSAAELSRKELQQMQQELEERLRSQLDGQHEGAHVLAESDLRSLLRLPGEEAVAKLPIIAALAYMVALDVLRIFRVASIRRKVLRTSGLACPAFGLVATPHRELELAIGTAREEAALGKRIVFLDRAQQVFHLWHVVHKPFSYSFAVLAAVHIVVVMMLGFH